MITVRGRIERKALGMGVWALISETGQTYELWQPPAELCRPLAQVEIQGEIKSEIMTIAMVGPVLSIEKFQILDPT
jgi:hypothetical protein